MENLHQESINLEEAMEIFEAFEPICDKENEVVKINTSQSGLIKNDNTEKTEKNIQHMKALLDLIVTNMDEVNQEKKKKDEVIIQLVKDQEQTMDRVESLEKDKVVLEKKSEDFEARLSNVEKKKNEEGGKKLISKKEKKILIIAKRKKGKYLYENHYFPNDINTIGKAHGQLTEHLHTEMGLESYIDDIIYESQYREAMDLIERYYPKPKIEHQIGNYDWYKERKKSRNATHKRQFKRKEKINNNEVQNN